jgi:hypothetical protein
VKRNYEVFVFGLVVAGGMAAASCGKASSDSEAASSKPIAAPVLRDSTREAAQAQANGKAVPTTDMHLILGTMGQEAKNRPKAGITAEPLFDALEAKANIKLAQREQYMGQSMHAAFCAGGLTTDQASADQLTVSMCEYPDDAAAQASLQYMNHTFNVAGARREAHHAAVLTIISHHADDHRVDAAFQVFDSL